MTKLKHPNGTAWVICSDCFAGREVRMIAGTVDPRDFYCSRCGSSEAFVGYEVDADAHRN